MNREIVQIPAEALGAIEGRPVLFPTLAYAGLEDGQLRAAWGLAWHLQRCWLWFEMLNTDQTYPMYVIRNARKMLRVARQMGEEVVYCWRDEHPLSAKLLKTVGFEPDGMEQVTFADGTSGEREVWHRWLH